MTLKTSYEEIVDVTNIGSPINTRDQNELLKKASLEKLTPSVKNAEKVLVLGIDCQNDFMEKGSLPVPNSHADIERFTRFIYNNMDKITDIMVSLDTHNPFQIFHPCWWIDENGENPDPYTLITINDYDSGKWKPVILPVESRDYLLGLKNKAKRDLMIWTYHCLAGTFGCALENQFSNMVYFHSVAKKSVVQKISKGIDPLSEMYGIFAPEYSVKGTINLSIFNRFIDMKNNNRPLYDKILIGGQARSHCVLESIRQLLEYFANNPEITQRVYFLEDCASDIQGCEQATKDALDDFKRKYGINIVKSTDLIL